MSEMRGQGGPLDLQIDYLSINQLLRCDVNNSKLPVRVCLLGNDQTLMELPAPDRGWQVTDFQGVRQIITHRCGDRLAMDLYLGDRAWIGSTEV